MDSSSLLIEFLTIATAHFFAVASPGPDFAIVLKHSINYGKRIAIITSLGVGTAIFIHVAYALMGIGLIISSTPWLYDLLILFASGFLLYLGFGAIRSSKNVKTNEQVIDNNVVEISGKRAFYLGFLTNGLNPKATIFFLSLFTVVVSAETPLIIKGLYGVYLALATTAWFCFLSLILTRPKVREFFNGHAYIFDRVMGWVLILLAVKITYSEIITKYLF
ncbi:LysE family translocator [Psychrosphaera sp. B3R10]|uniref:LysE family translocator n=1 Tax=Psychrosphaera algicola TaxID=3023714 RepID=A0ABT5FAK6_9GAMM|nr:MULTISPECIES: LysE family translocator [unclassified Psychrosphaera]MBU2882304.1 LysE family translocator [Psychrosphaera sp. I2R16]MBU2988985.1 LysE family translocator [Psychrosphaera sp. B3R10]MDC2887893.1 LysE family translocator [Psychrosphaera sp. G1-22]MDO6717999.1 LysE family translocator [Psychrosphaera sp. 1_MG-2023]